jgi:hypothetical protein
MQNGFIERFNRSYRALKWGGLVVGSSGRQFENSLRNTKKASRSWAIYFSTASPQYR